jgi:hypothetical protein
MTLTTRLAQLEATASPHENKPWLRVIGYSEGECEGYSEGECEAQGCALIDAGEALQSDSFIFRIIVPNEATCVT